jgi:hypothetical protein
MNRAVVRVIVVLGMASWSFAQQLVVPFDLCVRSDVWTRPSAAVQAKIWSDPRYPHGASAYEWTHNFVLTEPDSASLTYHSQNESGLWTDPRPSQCPQRYGDRIGWIEVWALNYLVTGISVSGSVYMITVIPQERGYDIIQFRRPASSRVATESLRFVGDDGTLLDEFVEVRPSVFAPTR